MNSPNNSFFDFNEQMEQELLNQDEILNQPQNNYTNPSACSAGSLLPHKQNTKSEIKSKNEKPTIEYDELYDNKEKFRCYTIVFTCYDKVAIDDPEAWLRSLQSKCTWTLGQLEKCPKTGNIHIQGMANSKEVSRWGF